MVTVGWISIGGMNLFLLDEAAMDTANRVGTAIDHLANIDDDIAAQLNAIVKEYVCRVEDIVGLLLLVEQGFEGPSVSLPYEVVMEDVGRVSAVVDHVASVDDDNAGLLAADVEEAVRPAKSIVARPQSLEQGMEGSSALMADDVTIHTTCPIGA